MKLVIVGGVAGGMSAAARARRLDESAQIIVLDKGKHVSFANCGLPYFIGDEITDPGALLVQTPQSLKAALNLDVRPEHEVVGLDAAAHTVTVKSAQGTHRESYDALILAPGANAVIPPLPGIGSARVRTLRTVDDAVALKDMADGAKDAVVLGAGFIGLEAAEALEKRGLNVTVVELAPQILPPLDAPMANLVQAELERLGISVRVGVGATEVIPGDERDVVVLADGTRIPADLIVISVGVRPATAVFEAAGIACDRGAILTDDHGRTNLPDVWAVGDATAAKDPVTGAVRPVALAGPANRAGRLVADDLFGLEGARPIPTPLGTAIVRAGNLTAAMVGANRRSLEQAGIDFDTIDLHPNQHAGYFPGASQIHLTVHFRANDGTILGAQAVGADGVDKRIDVLATAIRAKMAVGDLIDLDLCYSPPYGNAKDPVNLAGMFGQNVLDSTTALWHPADLDRVTQTSLILDTRSAGEFAGGHVAGALNIPHTQLRDRIDEVTAAAAGRPVRVLCASGMRSYIAHRVLQQAGFDSATLSGGMLALRAHLGDRGDSVIVKG
ncbi:FAD-dependent oxidoreductase [Rarobacter incanus]|uniref:NADPH-dependent 2,4-dienoyl-CoA reductase/sulfur reductase-like enzyme n=1 Tax=Rarobacter incanus TaxID=153494 RepID=A0A542SPT5_9MICO|nr:FAD-dependent oxidoreductase [Rarobacter incanus]TQK76630.1 NADPH-dependent 2,4-dienoyl-CoA reductase/sulfur reductase-like enzyme [Rarobacter incanus]